MQESPLVDAETYAILDALATPSTAQDVHDATGIPIATVYRRLTALSESSLVHSWREYRYEAGGDPEVYERTQDAVTISWEPPPVEQRLERAERLNK